MVQISEIASCILVFADIKISTYPPIIVSTNFSIFLYFYHTTSPITNTCSTNSIFFALIVVYCVFNARDIFAALSVPGAFVTFVAPVPLLLLTSPTWAFLSLLSLSSPLAPLSFLLSLFPARAPLSLLCPCLRPGCSCCFCHLWRPQFWRLFRQLKIVVFDTSNNLKVFVKDKALSLFFRARSFFNTSLVGLVTVLSWQTF